MGGNRDPLRGESGYNMQVFWISGTGALLDSCMLGGPDDDKLTNLWYDGKQAWVTGYTRSPYFRYGVGTNPYPQRNNTFLSRLELWPMAIKDEGEAWKKNDLRAWPNPTKGTLHVGIPGSSGTLIMLNTEGQEVGRWQIISNQTELSTAGLPSGAYLLQWQNPKGPLQTVKIVVQ